MAIAYFQHTPVGKSTQAQPYTTAAHARYILRKRAATVVRSHNMPRQYHAAQRFLNKYEDGLRKNGRVADKFIIAIPREFDQARAEKIIYRYGLRIGHGAAPFIFSFHWEENNPHAHMIFIDRDMETGERVYGTTMRNSTQQLKLAWQDEVNHEFLMMGQETRIDFRADQEKAAKQEETAETSQNDHFMDKSEMAQSDHIGDANEMVSERLSEPADEEAVADDPKEDMEYVLERTDRIRAAVDFKHELEHLRAIKAKLAHSAEQLAGATSAIEDAQQKNAVAVEAKTTLEQAVYQAEKNLSHYVKANGKLRGFELLGWKTPTRKAAEEAQSTFNQLQTKLEFAKKDYEQAERDVAYWQAMKESAYTNKEQAETQADAITAEYGDRKTLDEAESLITMNMHSQLEGLEPKELLQMVQDGQISEGDFRDAMEIIGTPEAQQLAREFDDYGEEQ